MFRLKTPLFAGAALALAALTTVSMVEPAAAKRSHRTRVARLRPAHQRPDYVGAPGFAGGAPGPVVPALIDPAIGPPGGDTALIAGLAPPANGGLLGAGLPIIGPFGF